MCGICAYVGSDGKGIKKSLLGLNMLLHRGYDSFGIAYVSGGDVLISKISKEKKKDIVVEDLSRKIPDLNAQSNLVLVHNRWRSIGALKDENAHPHYDKDKIIFLAQNGNVQNLSKFRQYADAWEPYSDTDTEVIANVLATQYRKTKNIIEAARKTLGYMEGANTIAFFLKEEPNKMYVASKGGVIYVGKNSNAVVAASEKSAFGVFGVKEDNIYHLQYNDIVEITHNGWEIFAEQQSRYTDDDYTVMPGKEGYKWITEKEIFEQAEKMADAMNGRLVFDKGITKLGGIEDLSKELRKAPFFHFIACGTSFHAGLFGELLFHRFGIPARAWVASEFYSSHIAFGSDDVFIFLSQSGGTYDAFDVLEEIKIKQNPCFGIVNEPGTKIWELAGQGIGVRAGKEIGVASTKSYVLTLAVITMLAIYLARQRKMTIDTGQRIIRELEALPEKIADTLKLSGQIKELAGRYANYKSCYFMGRYFNNVSAKEGDLKLKELSYFVSQSYPLGEMKHGPMTLIDPTHYSLVIAPEDSVLPQSIITINEIAGREGPILALTNQGTNLPHVQDTINVPRTLEYLTPIIMAVPLQLFAFYTGEHFNCNIDRPRHIAKISTVE